MCDGKTRCGKFLMYPGTRGVQLSMSFRELQPQSQFIDYLFKSLESENRIIKFFASLSLNTCTTCTGINRAYIERRYNCFFKDMTKKSLTVLKKSVIANFRKQNVINQPQYISVCELLEARDGCSILDHFTRKEIQEMLETAITSRN